MSPVETIAELKKVAGFSEVYHTTSFRCFRHAKDGGVQEVTVEIYDAGPDVDEDLRYSCAAHSDDGKVASGNPGATIGVALATVHWWDLDK